MTRYTSVTDADLSEMLGTIGVGSIEELFADIPAGLRLGRPLSLGDGLSEQEVYEELQAHSPPGAPRPRTRCRSSARACTTTTRRR